MVKLNMKTLHFENPSIFTCEENW